MKRRSAFTLVELMIYGAAMTALLTTTVTLYAVSVNTSSESLSRAASISAGTAALDSIARTIENAMDCVAIDDSGRIALSCVMPDTAVDTDGDGVADRFEAKRVSSTGYEQYGRGNRVWFYIAGTNGAFSNSGTILWRAVTSMSHRPLASDADKNWTMYRNTEQPRVGRATSISVAVDSANRMATITLVIDEATGQRSALAAGAQASKDAITLKRAIVWRNWRG